MSFSIFASASDPLSHVTDHYLHWGNEDGGGLDQALYTLSTLLTSIGVTKHVLWLLISATACVLVMILAASRLTGGKTGGRLGGLIEVLMLFIRDEVVRPFMGKEGDRFLPYIWSMFFFILFNNVLGLIPGAGTATGNLNITFALAGLTLVFYHAVGIKRNGFVHYVKANLLVGPAYLWWLMIPIELMGHVIKPCALAIRLFANMLAGHTMLAVFLGFCSLFTLDAVVSTGFVAGLSAGASIALYFLEIFVAFLQAFVFTFLATVFLSMAVHPDH